MTLRPIAALVLLATLPLSAQRITNRRASVVDVPARIAALKDTQDPLLRSAIKGLSSCHNLQPIPAPTGLMVIPHHYLSGSHGPTNPAEREATRVYEAFEHRITSGMNQYLATGNHVEAQCALDQLDTWAKAKALIAYDPHEQKDNSQAWFQAEWTLSAAGVTMSVLVNDPDLDIEEQKRVAMWLDTAARRLVSFEKPGDEDGNNHHYWRALAAISIGVVATDDKLFQFGLSTYKQAVSQIDKNGAFPLEMARHERAIHYQAFALQPLVLIAEFAEHQGIDLYAYTANGHTLRDAIVFLGRAVDDPTLVKPYTSDTQLLDIGSSDWAPFAFFTARFGTDGLGKTLPTGLTKCTESTRIGGSTTLLASGK